MRSKTSVATGYSQYYHRKYVIALVMIVVVCYFFSYQFMSGLKTRSDEHDHDRTVLAKTSARGHHAADRDSKRFGEPARAEKLAAKHDADEKPKKPKSKPNSKANSKAKSKAKSKKAKNDKPKVQQAPKQEPIPPEDLMFGQNNEFVNMTAIRNSSLIMVGGFGRSGTTLMRAILDVHPNIQCGPETRILVHVLGALKNYLNRDRQLRLIWNAGISNQTIDESVALFMYHTIVNHVPKTKRFCMKDPFLFNQLKYLYKLFPKTKFIYMVRDGRGNAYSYIYKSKSLATTELYKENLKWWNDFNVRAYSQCVDLGPSICLRVNYEDLVTQTNQTLRRIINFVGEPWNEGLLNHHAYIGSEVAVSKTEWSTVQIEKPIYQESINGWLEKIPYVSEEETRKLAPMIEYFGYSLKTNATLIEKQKENARVAEEQEAAEQAAEDAEDDGETADWDPDNDDDKDN